MRSHTAWGFLPKHTTHTVQLGTARASLELRAGQSIASKWVIWAVCVATVFTLPDELPLWMRLCWAVPVMLMAEINWRVCTQVMADLNQADLAGMILDEATHIDLKWRTAWEIVNHGAAGRDLSRADLRDADLWGADLAFLYDVCAGGQFTDLQDVGKVFCFIDRKTA